MSGIRTTYLLVIEGFPRVFATDPAASASIPHLTGTNFLPTVKEVLVDSVTINNELDPIAGTLESSPLNLSLVRSDELDIAFLGAGPPQATSASVESPIFLTADVSVLDTTIHTTLQDTTWGPTTPTFLISLDTETIEVHGDATNLFILHVDTRGVAGSTAQAHFKNVGGESVSPPIIRKILDTDSTISGQFVTEGKRATLYQVDNRDWTSPSVVYRGIIVTNGKLANNGTTWDISIDPISSVFKQKLGANLQTEVNTQGIYYPYQDPGISRRRDKCYIKVKNGAGLSVTLDISDQFFNSNYDWVAWVNSQLATLTGNWAGWGFTLHAQTEVALFTDQWTWRFTTDPTTPRYPRITQHTFIDPKFEQFEDLFGNPVSTVSASTTYQMIPEDSPPLDNSTFIGTPGVEPRGFIRDTARLYIDAAVPFGTVSSVDVTWDPSGAKDTENYTVTAYNSTDNYIELLWFRDLHSPRAIQKSWGGLADAPIVRENVTYTGSTIADVIQNIYTDAPSLANAGTVPFIHVEDVDIGGIATAQLEANPPDYAMRRIFQSGEDVDLKELIESHFHLYGISPVIDSNGKFSARFILSSMDPDVAITEKDIRNTPSIERSKYGNKNTIVIPTGYSPIDDEFKGREFKVNDLRGVGTLGGVKSLKIEAKSLEDASILTSGVPVDQIVEIAENTLRLSAAPYAILTAEVRNNLMSTIGIGSTVSLKHHALPRFGATSDQRFIGDVISVNRDLSSAYSAISIYVSLANPGGYAPGYSVVSHTLVSGLTYDLTVSASIPPPPATAAITLDTQTAENRLNLLDKVNVIEWDKATSPPTAYEGTIKTLTGNVIRVTFSPSAPTWANPNGYILKYSNNLSVTATEIYATDTNPHNFV